MQIAPFPLPSCISKVVHFRVPTVDDALTFSDLSEDQEEMHTTQYLNQLQDVSKQNGKLYDSAEWTGEDRRTALWWIFISTKEYPEITISYQCDTCEEQHYIDINAHTLADTSTAVTKLPNYQFNAHVNGGIIEGIRVHPLTGKSCEELETLSNNIKAIPAGTADRKRADVSQKIIEIAHHVTFPNEPEDRKEAIEYKTSFIRKMAVDTEFRSFFANVEKGLRLQRHGLLTRYAEGQYMLVAQHPNCAKAIEAGEEQSKILLVPFQANQFIATL